MPQTYVSSWAEVQAKIDELEAARHDVLQVVEAGNRILILSKKRAGRPPKVETRGGGK